MPGPAPRRSASLRRIPNTATIPAGQSTVTTPDLGIGSLTSATIVCSEQQATPDATAGELSAVGNANGTVTIKSTANATANTIVGFVVFLPGIP